MIMSRQSMRARATVAEGTPSYIHGEIDRVGRAAVDQPTIGNQRRGPRRRDGLHSCVRRRALPP